MNVGDKVLYTGGTTEMYKQWNGGVGIIKRVDSGTCNVLFEDGAQFTISKSSLLPIGSAIPAVNPDDSDSDKTITIDELLPITSTKYITTDSGNRINFATGSVRDTQEGKSRVDLIPAEFIGYLSETWIDGAYYDHDIDDAYIDDTLDALFNDIDYSNHMLLRIDIAYIICRFIAIECPSDSTLLPAIAILRLGDLLERGAAKYGLDNWRLGQSFSRVRSSLLRHAYQYLAYQCRYTATEIENIPEDHLAAVIFNGMALWQYAYDIAFRGLDASISDIAGVK